MTVRRKVKDERRRIVTRDPAPERPKGANFIHWKSRRQRELHEKITARGLR